MQRSDCRSVCTPSTLFCFRSVFVLLLFGTLLLCPRFSEMHTSANVLIKWRCSLKSLSGIIILSFYIDMSHKNTSMLWFASNDNLCWNNYSILILCSCLCLLAICFCFVFHYFHNFPRPVDGVWKYLPATCWNRPLHQRVVLFSPMRLTLKGTPTMLHAKVQCASQMLSNSSLILNAALFIFIHFFFRACNSLLFMWSEKALFMSTCLCPSTKRPHILIKHLPGAIEMQRVYISDNTIGFYYHYNNCY